MTESGIYSILNIENGKVYVGSAVNIKNRWSLHRHALKRGKHANDKLQKSWIKHGPDSFLFSVIEYVADKKDLIPREQFWIDKMRSADKAVGYNICLFAGSQLGMKHTEQAKEKNAAAHRGKKQSAETIAKRRESNTWTGHTEESRMKIAIAATGRKHTPETKAKLRAARILQGLPPIAPRTKEYKAKISATLKGRKLPEETKRKMSEARTGVKHSPERIAKMVAGRLRAKELRAAA